jgi:VWFA-related protein
MPRPKAALGPRRSRFARYIRINMSRTAKLLTAVLPVYAAFAQSDSSAVQPPAVFRSETNLVLARFQVKPKTGPPSDLRPEDIQLTEDGTVQKIAFVQGGTGNPLSSPVELNLLFGDIPTLWADPATQALRLSAMDANPNVSVALWVIGDKLVQLAPPTRDARTLNRALDTDRSMVGPLSSRPIAPYVSALARAAAQGRSNVIRTLVMSPNGCYGGNQNEVKAAIEAVQKAGIAVFPVSLIVQLSSGLAPDQSAIARQTDSYRSEREQMSGQKGSQRPPSGVFSVQPGFGCDGNSDFLENIARATGGRRLRVDRASSQTFDAFLSALGDQVLRDYVAGFYSSSAGEPKAHKIKVTLKDSRHGQITGYARTIVH